MKKVYVLLFATLCHHLFKVTEGQFIAEIPADAA
jgi:hypothetical protein